MPVPRPVTALTGRPVKTDGQGRGRGGVADAHVTRGDDVHPGGGGRFGPLHPHQQGLQGLLPGHGRLLGHIAGAIGHFPGNELRDLGEIVVDADVHHLHPGPGLAGQDVDAGAAPEEVVDHLIGDVLGIGAHPFGHHAVVRGKHHHPFGLQVRHGVLADGHVAGRQLLQPAQAARGLGEGVQALLGPGQPGGVHRFNLGDNLG